MYKTIYFLVLLVLLSGCSPGFHLRTNTEVEVPPHHPTIIDSPVVIPGTMIAGR